MSNQQSETQKADSRGKRNTARGIELLLLTLILLSVWDVASAFKVLEFILVYAVGLIVALRGLDAHYNPKRV